MSEAPVVTMKQLFEAGVHFGHQTRRWNPKMKRFIYGDRNGIYIIDLQQTLKRIEIAYTFVRDTVADGGTILFVGTKKQAQDPIQCYAEKCGMPYINERWLGGMLTNFETISKRGRQDAGVPAHARLRRVRGHAEEGSPPDQPRARRSSSATSAASASMEKLPDAVFVLDTKKEHIAVTEANKLGIPIVAVVDTNCDPDVIQYVIPGNDDAIRSGTLMCRIIADAVEEGQLIASKRGHVDAHAAALRRGGGHGRRQQAEARRQAAAASRRARGPHRRPAGRAPARGRGRVPGPGRADRRGGRGRVAGRRLRRAPARVEPRPRPRPSRPPRSAEAEPAEPVDAAARADPSRRRTSTDA